MWFWSILVDLLFVATFLVFMIFFLKYGFAKAALRIGKTWLSVICSVLIGPWLSNLLQDLFIRDMISKGLLQTLTDLVANNPNGYNLEELFQNLPAGFTNILGNYGVSYAALEAEFGSATYATPEILQAISVRLAEPCNNAFSSIIGYMVGFIVPWVFIKWLNLKIRRNKKIPIYRYIDAISGCIVGIIIGGAALVFLSVVVQTVFQIIVAFDMHSPVVDVYENSLFCRLFTRFDVLLLVKNSVRGLLG